MKQTAARLIQTWQSPSRSALRQYFLQAASIIGIWALIAVFYSLITTFTMVGRGEQIQWLEAYGFELLCIWPWMVATPIVFRVAYKYRLKRPHLLRNISIHLLLALTIFAVHSLNQSLAVNWFFNEPTLNGYIINDFVFFFNTRFALYAGLVLAAYLLEFYKKNHDSRLYEAQIKRELTQAKFDSIKHRIQPLFVLRTLDAIEEHMEYNSNDAGTDKMIADFSELLRVMLDQRGNRLILLEDDFHAVDLYIQLFNKRFGLNLEFQLDVDSDSTQAAIPYGLYIVSVFEHLAQHHLEKFRQIKRIYYQARAFGEKLELKVLFPDLYISKKDINLLFQETSFDELNTGLQTYYNKDYKVAIDSDDEVGGFCILLSIPYINYTKVVEEENHSIPNRVQV